MADELLEKVILAGNFFPGTSVVAYTRIHKCDLDGNDLEIFINISEASKKTGISRPSINGCIRGKNKTAYGFIWKRKINLPEIKRMAEEVFLAIPEMTKLAEKIYNDVPNLPCKDIIGSYKSH